MKKEAKNQTSESLTPDQLGILVDNHRSFQQFLARRVESDSVAEDLLQQSLKKALEAPAHSTEQESILAWFYKILRNTLTDYYRKRDVEQRGLRDLAQSPETNDSELEAGICQCMKGLLPAIKPEYSSLLARIDLGEETPEDVAKDLGISRGNLDVRLHRARQALKSSLVKSCGTCTEHGCLNCTCG